MSTPRPCALGPAGTKAAWKKALAKARDMPPIGADEPSGEAGLSAAVRAVNPRTRSMWKKALTGRPSPDEA